MAEEVLALVVPKYPEDFRQMCADGGFYYRQWHPHMPTVVPGSWSNDTWPNGEDLPEWTGGLWVYPHEDESWETVEDWDRCRMIVVWEWGFELESGPYEEAAPGEVQSAVDRVLAEVNRDRSFAGRI